MKVDMIMGGVDSSDTASFLSKKKFSKMIEDTVRQKVMTYMDAVIYLCEENTIEVEDVKKYISTSIKEKIELEAMNLNFLPKSGESLPE
jgi:hypothetical protein